MTRPVAQAAANTMDERIGLARLVAIAADFTLDFGRGTLLAPVVLEETWLTDTTARKRSRPEQPLAAKLKAP
jgi:hypothetical protein